MPAAAPSSPRGALGYGRLAIGSAMAVAPGLVGRLWWGQEMTASAKAIMRGMGARDAIIGAGTALVGDAAAGPWLKAGVAADLADLAAAVLGGSKLAGGKRLATVAFAGAGAAAGVLIDRSAR